MGNQDIRSDEFQQIWEQLCNPWCVFNHVWSDVVNRHIAGVEVVKTCRWLHEPLFGFHDFPGTDLNEAHRAGGADKTVCCLKIYCCEVQCHAQ